MVKKKAAIAEIRERKDQQMIQCSVYKEEVDFGYLLRDTNERLGAGHLERQY